MDEVYENIGTVPIDQVEMLEPLIDDTCTITSKPVAETDGDQQPKTKNEGVRFDH